MFTTPVVNLAPSESGDQLVGEFDFGVKFAQIDSHTVELTLPAGYEVAAVSTGNSSYFRTLEVILHSAEEAIQFTEIGPSLPAASLSQSLLHVAANEPASFRVVPWIRILGEPAIVPAFQEFLLSGQGQVTITDLQSHSTHPLPDRIVTGSSTSYAAPTGIEKVRITITGTAVPEPSVTSLLAAAPCLTLLRSRRRPND